MNIRPNVNAHTDRSRSAGRANAVLLALLMGCPSTEGVSGEDGAESGEAIGTTDDVPPSSGSTAGTTNGTRGGPDETSGGPAPGSGSSTSLDDPTGQATESDTESSEAECQTATCYGHVYECGDCLDNDGDGLVDGADPDCWGPCDNNESGFKPNLPGGTPAGGPCPEVDCFFDHDHGSGNDDCHWSFRCDPLDPHPSCSHDLEWTIPSGDVTCEEALVSQSEQCLSVCGPFVPNGCDCFGCCGVTVSGETHTVYLGSEDADTSVGTCSVAEIADPTKCRPCTQVPACLNPCEPEACEICIGDPTLPPGCDEAGCPAGVQSCLPAQHGADCPDGMTCITGCCTPFPD
jgi:hypothetical protein